MLTKRAEHWIRKAALAREKAEQMHGTPKATMPEIAKLYDRLAEQTGLGFPGAHKGSKFPMPNMVRDRRPDGFYLVVLVAT